jgi:hypothetical protein
MLCNCLGGLKFEARAAMTSAGDNVRLDLALLTEGVRPAVESRFNPYSWPQQRLRIPLEPYVTLLLMGANN